MINSKWIRALRSGNYRQGRGILYKTNGGTYCCLGVAMRLLYPESKSFKELVTTHNQSDWSMPTATNRRKMGLTKTQACQLAKFNDDDKWNFAKIANFLAGKIDKYGNAVKRGKKS